MTYSISITGLTGAQKMLGASFRPALDNGLKALAGEVRDRIVPYPPTTIANSPSNPAMRWYERGYGPHWWVRGARLSVGYGAKTTAGQRREILGLRRKGTILHSQQTSQKMNRRWSIAKTGPYKWEVGNTAKYAHFLHKDDDQVGWAGQRGWVTDARVVRDIVQSGKAKKIMADAIVAQIHRVAGR